MLTTRNGEDYLCIPSDRFCKRKICCSVTGMQRHDHVHFIHARIVRNIPLQKLQLFISIFFTQLITMTYHLFFQVQSYNTNIYLF